MRMRVALLGEGALALQCLAMLLETALSPSVIVSADGSLADAAAQVSCPHFTRRDDWLNWLREHGCDLLLSIRNPWVLGAEELRQVKVQALNFHDSLLPDYAGMHATSWAILNGETQHGVTWHAMSVGLDAGGIAAQVVVPVLPADTAWTLNARCFDSALNTFSTVLATLIEHGQCPLTPQQGPRRYFGLRRRPDSQGLMDLTWPCEQALRTVRALDFGHANNPLAWPKLFVGGQVLLFKEAQLLPHPLSCEPGTLVRADSEGLEVAFADGVLRLTGLRTLSGLVMSGGAIEACAGPWVGRVLPSWSPAVRREVSVLHEELCVRERQWVSALKEPINPLSHHDVPKGESHQWHKLSRWSSSLGEGLSTDRSDWALAVFMAYMARVHQCDQGHLGWCRPELARAGHGLFAAFVPWPLKVDLSSSVSSQASLVSEQRRRMAALGTYSIDLTSRAPELAALPSPPDQWPVAFMIASHEDSQAHVRSVDLLATISPDGLDLGCWVSASCPAWLIEALDTRLATLAEAMLASPEMTLSDLPLMDEGEWHQVAVAPNAQGRELPEVGIHALIAQAARRTPDADALIHGDQVLSHRELDERSSILATRLLGAGVCKGSWVGLAMSRSVDAVVAILAILKAGAAYVPLDVQLPVERLRAMVGQVRPALILTQRVHVETMCEQGLVMWCLDEAAQRSDLLAATPATISPSSGDDLAYCIFTSGSTGMPKGVKVAHRGLVNHALAMVDNYQLSALDRVLCSASLSFDVSLEQMFPTLVAGACIVLRPDDLFDSMSRFDGWGREQRITVMALPTAWWHEWVRHLTLVQHQVPEALRVIAVGTEKAQSDVLVSWCECGGRRTRFLQGYGPTEATITSAMFAWHADDATLDLTQQLPIGQPLPNTEVHVLDAFGNHVPIGVEGEMYIAGAGLALGYLGAPELTHHSFQEKAIRGSCGQQQIKRMYRTGDRARWSPTGQLLFMGRKDFQVKLRGHRVELGDIESVLRLHPGVQDVVVLLRDDVGPQPALVAYVLSKSSLLPAELLQACLARLPKHMVPSHVVVLAHWPLTANGKVDRRRLPAPIEPTSEDDGVSVDRFDNDVEVVVSQVFASVLGRSKVPPDASFFDLGGDSLRAMALITQLERALSMRLSLVDVFACPSVRLLTHRVNQGKSVSTPFVIKLKEGRGAPVWLLAGVLYYAKLAKLISADNPVYVLLLPEEDILRQADGYLPPVQESAQRYLSVIREHTQTGPVVLGGFSYGGVVAYEVAQAMRMRGEEVPWLILIDTCLPSVVRRGMLGWLHRQQAALSKVGYSELRARAFRRLERLLMVPRRLSVNQRSQVEKQFSREHKFAKVLKEFEAHMLPYAGNVLLFRSKGESLSRSAPEHLGWKPWTIDGMLHIHEVDGCHLGMMEMPHVASMAADFSRVLSALEAPTAVAS